MVTDSAVQVPLVKAAGTTAERAQEEQEGNGQPRFAAQRMAVLLHGIAMPCEATARCAESQAADFQAVSTH